MAFSEQLKRYFFIEAIETKADIEQFQKEMQETKEKAQKEGITLEEAANLSLYAQILEIGTSISLMALRCYEKELEKLDRNPMLYDNLNPIAWAQGMAAGQQEVEKWLKAA